MSKVACSHCRLEFDESHMIKEKGGEETLYFCCKGCQGVYRLLHTEGLEGFYQKKKDVTLHPVSAFETSSDTQRFDTEGFQKRYVKIDDDGFYTVSLVIEGIHCSACVWLNEKVLHKLEGIIEASINYSTHKAKITWDPNTVKLSKIIETIRSIGYNAHPYDPALQEEQSVKLRKEYYTRILVAVFGAMNIMWLAIAHYAGYFSGIEQRFKDILNVAQFLLATPVLFYSGWVFFRGAYYGYKNRTVNMDTLVATGALSAYLYSIYAMVTRNGEVYFDSVVMIITFVLVGKYLEVLSKKQAADTLDSLTGTVPTEVTLIRPDGSKTLTPIENVELKDRIELKAGEKVVIDGIVKEGEASFDESSLTGESLPVLKKPGDLIHSGSVCLDATVRYEATRTADTSLLRTLTTLLEDAVTKKPRIEQLANRVSGYFSTVILFIALATFGGWYLYSGSFENALIIAISVIVIACPCALGLATPMATLVGISLGAKRSVLFKEARHLETMAKCDLLALDKTGTITEGKPRIVNVHTFNDFDKSLLYGLVLHSKHPVSQAIATYYQNQAVSPAPLTRAETIQAKGLKATTPSGTSLLGGNTAFLEENGIDTSSLPSTDRSVFAFAVNGKAVALFELEDILKEGAIEAIEKITSLGVEVVMLTGDKEEAAQKIAHKAGIKRYYAQLLPQDKARIIQNYHHQNRRVVMAGDGINDTLALSRSDIAIAMGGGADIAVSVSDVILLDERPVKLYEAFSISKRSFKAIKENLAFSLLYNFITVPLAVAGFVNPLVAALSMSLSSLVVVANSLRIKRHRF